MPRILHVAHSDTLGGAARAAYRLHTALRESGTDSRMLVGWKRTVDQSIYAWGSSASHRARVYGDRLLTILAGGRWSSSWSNNRFPRAPFSFTDGWEPEVLNLHWIWNGFAALRSLELWSTPHVWTMHDMAAMTGGCHYAGDCEKFTTHCGRCPQLHSSRKHDCSTAIQAERIAYARRVCPVVVAPSRWMAGKAVQSMAYRAARVVTIPNGLCFDEFRPLDRGLARAKMGLPSTDNVIAFGAVRPSDPRKGYDLLVTALAHLATLVSPRTTRILVFGQSKIQIRQIHGFNCHEVGVLETDESLATAYSAADVFVAPSREDNLPNTLIEALACGTPGVAFAIGGIPEIIAHGETGWLAPAFRAEALARYIQVGLSYAGNSALRDACRAQAERCYSQKRQVRDYIELYASLL